MTESAATKEQPWFPFKNGRPLVRETSSRVENIGRVLRRRETERRTRAPFADRASREIAISPRRRRWKLIELSLLSGCRPRLGARRDR